MKQALVTGFSKNIGSEIARQLSRAGYFIHGVYNTSEKASIKLKEELVNVEIYKSDFSKREQVLKLVENLSNTKFDVIVNDAGIINFEKFDEISIENWDNIFNINVHAPFLIVHGLRNNLNKDAVVINITSTDAFVGSFVSMGYSATKAALVSMTKSLGNILGLRGIRVVGIAPGWVGSGMESPAIKEAVETNPLGRNAEPREIANLVSFIVSTNASFINGTTIVIDGGYTNVDPILKKEAENL